MELIEYQLMLPPNQRIKPAKEINNIAFCHKETIEYHSIQTALTSMMKSDQSKTNLLDWLINLPNE